MPTKLFFFILLLLLSSGATAQFTPDPNGVSAGQSSDQCLTNPTSAACAMQSQTQDQSSSNGSQNSQRNNDPLLNTDLSGNSNGQSPNPQNGSNDIDLQDLSSQAGQKGTAQPSEDLKGMTPPLLLPPEQQPIENDFQNFVQISIGKRLPIFGSALFSNAPSTFAQANRIPVTGKYIVGPGDELIISVWGPITLNARVMVDREGNVAAPARRPGQRSGRPV